MQDTHEYKERACHEGCYAETAHSVILYDAIHNDDERSGRTAYLNLASAKEGDDETCYDSSENTGLRSST